MEEKLFLVDDRHYLHVQECDEGGYDYTFYDKESYAAVDGGRMDEPEEWGITTILQAAEAICSAAVNPASPAPTTRKDACMEAV